MTVRADLGTKGAKTRISAHAEGAGTLQAVSVPKGVVVIGVDDVPGTDPAPEGTDSESEGIFANPKTGDAVTWSLVAATILVVAGALAAACRFARRNRQ